MVQLFNTTDSDDGETFDLGGRVAPANKSLIYLVPKGELPDSMTPRVAQGAVLAARLGSAAAGSTVLQVSAPEAEILSRFSHMLGLKFSVLLAVPGLDYSPSFSQATSSLVARSYLELANEGDPMTIDTRPESDVLG